MLSTDKLVIPDQVISRRVDDQLVLIDLRTGTYFGLDTIGARVWQLIEAGKTLAEVFDLIPLEYDVSKCHLEPDLLEFLHQLAVRDLIRTG